MVVANETRGSCQPVTPQLLQGKISSPAVSRKGILTVPVKFTRRPHSREATVPTAAASLNVMWSNSPLQTVDLSSVIDSERLCCFLAPAARLGCSAASRPLTLCKKLPTVAGTLMGHGRFGKCGKVPYWSAWTEPPSSAKRKAHYLDKCCAGTMRYYCTWQLSARLSVSESAHRG